MIGASNVDIFFSNVHGGSEYPLTPFEAYCVEMIIELSCCRHSTKASEGLKLINRLIKSAEIENKVKDWKLKYAHANNIKDCDGASGSGCWNIFKKRNDDRIVIKKGNNFELDQQNWTTYSKYKLAHDNIAIEMVDSGIVVELEVSPLEG